MVPVEDHLPLCNVGDREDAAIIPASGRPLEAHADLQSLGKGGARLNMQQFIVVVAKGLLGFQPDFDPVRHAFALQGGFDDGKDVLMAAMQVLHGFRGAFDEIAPDVGQFDIQRYDSIGSDIHDVCRLRGGTLKRHPARPGSRGDRPGAGATGMLEHHCNSGAGTIIRAMKMALLGDLTVRQFLSRHWQKRPMVVRQALPGFKGVISTSRLFSLATRDDVESRMVSRSNRWAVSHGPFTATDISGHPQRNWTLLVQGLNLHHAPADELLRHFSFIPQARLDDIMVSHAVPGGGVGPHTDSYDVFLLQAQGRRLWRIGPVRRPRFVPGLDLRILDGFEATEEYLMEPGDLLYLPPGWGHDGVALDECTTYSVGFRAPSRKELLSEFLLRMSERVDLPGLYSDPDLKEQSCTARIPSDMVRHTHALITRLRFRTVDVEHFLGEYLSEPKPNVVFRRPHPVLAPSAFLRMAARHGVKLDLRSLMLHRGAQVFINGESLQPSRDSLATLRQLADRRELPAAACRADIARMTYDWYAAGWLHLRHAAASGKRP